MKYFIYDLEVLINFFSFTGKFTGEEKIYTFEMSSRKDQKSELLRFLSDLQSSNVHMVGFNNLGFDYPILHNLLNSVHTFDYKRAYHLCCEIINSQDYGNSNLTYSRDRIIPQIDLVKINHFDNKAKRTPLKTLQFNMRFPSVEDLPVELGVDLTSTQMDQVLAYNLNDVLATEEFFNRCKHLIDMRKELLDNGVLSGDALNYSDVKLGGEYLIKKIGRSKCFHGSEPRQTIRESIAFKDIILPSVSFMTEPFSNVLEWFKAQTYYVGGENPKHEAKLAGLDFFFGVGGAHGSVTNKKYVSNDTHVIKDIDVASMYPSIAIANSFAPEHLGKDFSLAYAQLVIDRRQYKKGTTMNATLKLASNGAFGNGDNKFSCFYDPKFPKQITINGQLQILQLVEVLSLIPGLEIIQVNTDGVTVHMPRAMNCFFQFWKSSWETMTGLKLEEAEYSKMWIADVNNYLCLTTEGKIKAKGKYWYPKEPKDYDGVWNKDFSTMVVQKVIEQSLINEWKPCDLLKIMSDPFDFMIRYKTPKGAKVFIGNREMQKTVRYYVSTKGEPMKKVAQPKGDCGEYKRKNKIKDQDFLKIIKEIGPGVWDERIHTNNKSKYGEDTTSIEAGRLVKECNVASRFNWSDVDWDYYLKEVEKLYV